MKKFLTVTLVAILCFALVGCGNSSTDNSKSKENDKNDNEDSNTVVSSSNTTWSTFYTEYAKVEGNISDKISNAIDAEESTNMDYIWAALNSLNGSIPLAFTYDFFTGDETVIKSTFSIFGYTDISYSENGDTAKLTGKNSDGEDIEYILKYDSNSCTAELTVKTGDSIAIVSIYCKDNVYAKTYYNEEETNTYLELYSKGDSIKLSYGDNGTKPESLYKNANRIE